MFLTQVKFSEYIGVHKATVSKMKKRRELVMHGKKVDVEKTLSLLRTVGKTFDANNKMISSNTAPGPTIDKSDSNLMNTEFIYPVLSEIEKLNRQKKQVELELQEEASDLGFDLHDISKELIESKEKWEVERTKIFFQGKIEEAKYLETIGKLVPRNEVEEEQFLIARTIRDAFMGMSNRIAHQLVGKKKIHDIKMILDDEALKVMENLSR